MEKIKIETRAKYCVFTDRLVDLVHVLFRSLDKEGPEQGSWIERSVRCSEYGSCDRNCKWVGPLSLVTEDPLHDYSFNDVLAP